MGRSLRETLAMVREDIKRAFEVDAEAEEGTLKDKVRVLANSTSLHAVLAHRFSRYVRHDMEPRLLRLPMRPVARAVEAVSSLFWGVNIDSRADIGPGLYLGHVGNIWMGPVKMGKHCNITHNVTMGQDATAGTAVPTIGDRVWFGTGAVVFGKITIGDGATIGPLTVVQKDVPAKCNFSGNPGRGLSLNQDNRRVIYGEFAADKYPPLPDPPKPEPIKSDGPQSEPR